MAAFERELIAAYDWPTYSPEKLAAMMAGARATLAGEELTIDISGDCFQRALKSVGLPQRMLLHRLREIPE